MQLNSDDIRNQSQITIEQIQQAPQSKAKAKLSKKQKKQLKTIQNAQMVQNKTTVDNAVKQLTKAQQGMMNIEVQVNEIYQTVNYGQKMKKSKGLRDKHQKQGIIAEQQCINKQDELIKYNYQQPNPQKEAAKYFENCTDKAVLFINVTRRNIEDKVNWTQEHPLHTKKFDLCNEELVHNIYQNLRTKIQSHIDNAKIIMRLDKNECILPVIVFDEMFWSQEKPLSLNDKDKIYNSVITKLSKDIRCSILFSNYLYNDPSLLPPFTMHDYIEYIMSDLVNVNQIKHPIVKQLEKLIANPEQINHTTITQCIRELYGLCTKENVQTSYNYDQLLNQNNSMQQILNIARSIVNDYGYTYSRRKIIKNAINYYQNYVENKDTDRNDTDNGKKKI